MTLLKIKKVISIQMQNSSVVEGSRSLYHVYERKNNTGKKSERKESKTIENYRHGHLKRNERKKERKKKEGNK
jgi:hypothetical protein